MFTGNGSGGTSSSVTLQLQKIGSFVRVHVPVFTLTSGTGTNTLSSNTAIDAAFRPAGTVSGLCVVRDNASAQATPGQIVVTTGGILQITRDGTGAAFTNSSTVGIAGASPFTLEYYIG